MTNAYICTNTNTQPLQTHKTRRVGGGGGPCKRTNLWQTRNAIAHRAGDGGTTADRRARAFIPIGMLWH